MCIIIHLSRESSSELDGITHSLTHSSSSSSSYASNAASDGVAVVVVLGLVELESLLLLSRLLESAASSSSRDRFNGEAAVPSVEVLTILIPPNSELFFLVVATGFVASGGGAGGGDGADVVARGAVSSAAAAAARACWSCARCIERDALDPISIKEPPIPSWFHPIESNRI